jgi:hypothetical protein
MSLSVVFSLFVSVFVSVSLSVFVSVSVSVFVSFLCLCKFFVGYLGCRIFSSYNRYG